MSAQQNAPPVYNPLHSLASDFELPAYSARGGVAAALPLALGANSTPDVTAVPAPKEYSSELRNSWGKPWATLTLLADPRSSPTVPTFVEGSDITGSVSLNLRNHDPIKSVVIIIKGNLIAKGEADKRLNFVQSRELLWTTSMGDPRTPSSAAKEWDGKLHGQYRWPFSINLQKAFTAAIGEEFRLPHTFTEHFARANVEYYIELRIIRGKFRPDDKSIARFAYFSMQQPNRASPLRELAYRNHTKVPGPSLDPGGWHTLEPVQIRGTIFGARSVDVKCTVFLAMPLCYTRGSSIPCALTIETDDAQAADILASIKSSALYLQRCIECSFGDSAGAVLRPCGQATWWPSSDIVVAQGSGQRYLMGEIHLRDDLQPSTAIKEFRIEYAVVLFPPSAVAFKPEISDPLISQRIEIVIRFAPGPRPRQATPPTEKSSDALVVRYYARRREEANLRPLPSGFLHG
ncbi:hypothetical protein C8F04DRAFT_187597 [Mycena alexandri]|uniref:Arrestin-like N-terminal domain-containing protein n=1 Tax=Mycena alexandri TaxID=1745969 RepID=A0AAD6T731_9AGAR|nr:hypothetical protein C8F04DRAFT_187597 [Mycena alexandri]